LELKLPQGAVSLSPQAARSVAAQAASGQLRLEVKTVSTASLNTRQQAAVGSAPVYDINLTSGSQYITAFDGGLVTVALPYTLKPGENPAGVVVWYLDEAGNIQRMNGMYDVRTQTVIFTTDHFSKYFMTYDPNAAAEAEAAAAAWANPFGDVHAGDWFYGDVAYAHRNGLFGGTSAVTFSPNLPMNRAMLATVLGRMAKVNASVYAAAFSFGDVAAGQYYAPYVQWAHANAIMTGAGGGAFVPGGPVARQDLAVALMNYARHTGKQLPVKQAYTGFADDGAIDAYARDSVEALCRAGIIGGKPGNLFDPAGSVTRAEVAAVLRRFIEAGR
ncbi:MAG: S-layer homology domain-containing protein, partial [Peptococcaceae bacterium]|nr:S-layer homology domain-containing protein [Peptococcaceae bacterium]